MLGDPAPTSGPTWKGFSECDHTGLIRVSESPPPPGSAKLLTSASASGSHRPSGFPPGEPQGAHIHRGGPGTWRTKGEGAQGGRRDPGPPNNGFPSGSTLGGGGGTTGSGLWLAQPGLATRAAPPRGPGGNRAGQSAHGGRLPGRRALGPESFWGPPAGSHTAGWNPGARELEQSQPRELAGADAHPRQPL